MTSMKIIVAFVGLVASSAGQPLLEHDRAAIIRTDANLVLVPVTVIDDHGTAVPNLGPSNFVLKEEKTPQTVLSVSRENAPISLGIVFDLSGSMSAKMEKAHAAIHEFLKNIEPEDEMFLVTFADRPELRVSFTDDPAAIESALLFAKPGGSTALYDAVALTMAQMRRANNRRKVLFLVSDGGDNHSRLTERELRRQIEEEDVQIHAIGIHDSSDRMAEARGPWILEDLAKLTGGQHHMIADLSELPIMAAKMSNALHEFYVLGYRPSPPGLAGTYRRITVQLARGVTTSRVWVYARRGYRMP